MLAIDLVLTDPPYGISHPTNYKGRGRSVLAECKDYREVMGDDVQFDPQWILSLDVPTILWGGNYFADKLPPMSGWLIWDKMRPHTLDQATAEMAWTNCVKGARMFRYMWNGMLRDGDDVLVHPTQKPIALMRWCLSLKWTENLQTIFDPYMGSGTTLRAAKDLGRKAIGIELDEGYCEIAANRMAQEVMTLC